MNSLVIIGSARDSLREELQSDADALLARYNERKNSIAESAAIDKLLAEAAEGEKITRVSRGDDVVKLMDNLEAKHNAGEDRKIISIS